MTDPKPNRRAFLKRSVGVLTSSSVLRVTPLAKALAAPLATDTVFPRIEVRNLVIHERGWTIVSRSLLEDATLDLKPLLAAMMEGSVPSAKYL